jgi:hypothetical protein
MARLTIPELLPGGPKPGIHIARLAEVKEKISEAGNVVWNMLARFPDKSQMRFYVTFADSDKARRLVVFFLKSLGLVLPENPGAQIDVAARDVVDRLFFCKVELDEDGAPRIVKFICEDEATGLNPELRKIARAPQALRALKPVNIDGGRP